jgi:hypothetical protein
MILASGVVVENQKEEVTPVVAQPISKKEC